jgi:hypothetical protein
MRKKRNSRTIPDEIDAESSEIGGDLVASAVD